MDAIHSILRFSLTEYGVTPFCEEYLLSCGAMRRLPLKPKSVISMIFPYYSKALVGNISKYAMVSDYHTVVGNYLQDLCDRLTKKVGGDFVPFVDLSPIPEVMTAAKAGLGFLGKNGLLIHPKYGSYLFLGEIVTNHIMPYTSADPRSCLNCGLCERRCLGHAIKEGKLDKNSCLSHITQSKRMPTQEQKEKMMKNGLLWGCDTCQDVCPMNRNVLPTPLSFFQKDIVATVCAAQIEELCKTRAFGFRGPEILHRNYQILYGNSKT